MMIPHITRVFVPESAIVGDLESLELVSLDENAHVLGRPDQYNLKGYLVPVNQLEQFGVPELVSSPAAMVIGLSTHERAVLLRQLGGIWQLLLRSGSSEPEAYSFRERPEPRPVPVRVQRKPQLW